MSEQLQAHDGNKTIAFVFYLFLPILDWLWLWKEREKERRLTES